MRSFVLALAAFTMFAVPALAADGDDTAPADTPAISDDASFDAQFQCPETIENADARIDEYAGWTAWARANHPEWGFKKRLDVRYGLLRRHACATTLAAIANSEKPAFRP